MTNQDRVEMINKMEREMLLRGTSCRIFTEKRETRQGLRLFYIVENEYGIYEFQGSLTDLRAFIKEYNKEEMTEKYGEFGDSVVDYIESLKNNSAVEEVEEEVMEVAPITVEEGKEVKSIILLNAIKTLEEEKEMICIAKEEKDYIVEELTKLGFNLTAKPVEKGWGNFIIYNNTEKSEVEEVDKRIEILEEMGHYVMGDGNKDRIVWEDYKESED